MITSLKSSKVIISPPADNSDIMSMLEHAHTIRSESEKQQNGKLSYLGTQFSEYVKAQAKSRYEERTYHRLRIQTLEMVLQNLLLTKNATSNKDWLMAETILNHRKE